MSNDFLHCSDSPKKFSNVIQFVGELSILTIKPTLLLKFQNSGKFVDKLHEKNTVSKKNLLKEFCNLAHEGRLEIFVMLVFKIRKKVLSKNGNSSEDSNFIPGKVITQKKLDESNTYSVFRRVKFSPREVQEILIPLPDQQRFEFSHSNSI